MVSFEIFVKSMPPSLSELKVIPSFCFAFKIPDDMTATTIDKGTPIFEKMCHPFSGHQGRVHRLLLWNQRWH